MNAAPWNFSVSKSTCGAPRCLHTASALLYYSDSFAQLSSTPWGGDICDHMQLHPAMAQCVTFRRISLKLLYSHTMMCSNARYIFPSSKLSE